MRAPFQSRFAARLRAEAAARAAQDNGNDPDAALARVETLSQLARTIWFSLLAYLAFVTLTLFSVRDVDFFSLERAIDLPLVNIAIPTESFFLAAPVLGAALHIYLHLYLLKLWDTVATLPATIDGRPVGERMFPWMIGDWALRRRPDRDAATAPRPMAWLADWTTFLLVWAAAPLTLFGFWWRSMPAHEEWLTLVIAVPLAFSLYASRKSLRRAHRRLQAPGEPHRPATPWQRWTQRTGFMLLTVTLAIVGWLRTEGGFDAYLDDGPTLAEVEQALGFEVLAPIDLAGADLARQPPDWLSRETARRAFRIAWCRDHAMPLLACEAPRRDDFETMDAFNAARLANVEARLVWCRGAGDRLGQSSQRCDEVLDALDTRFETEWRERRAGYLATLAKPDLSGRDLRGARTENAFLAGINLGNARLDHADLMRSQLEAVRLSGARLDGAWLQDAFLEDADLRGASLVWTNLVRARLQDSTLRRADLSGANLIGARLEGADLNGARLDGANLREARLTGAFADASTMREAILRDTRLDGAALRGAQLIGAVLRGADLSEAMMRAAQLQGADLSGARLDGADLGAARLQGADLSKAQATKAGWDGTVFGNALLHGTDFTGARDLTRRQLDDGTGVHAIGNADTILPRDAETGAQLHVWSCWEAEPEGFAALLSFYPPFAHETLRTEWLCSDENPRVRTGTPAPE